MPRILVLGISGMLGSLVFDYLSKNKGFIVSGTSRKIPEAFKKQSKSIYLFEANELKSEKWLSILRKTSPDYIINCIGIIKPFCKDDDSKGVQNAIKINALFPQELSNSLIEILPGCKIIQIATDCVYDGKTGNYSEKNHHNALDVYGKTKSLGEVNADNFLNIRCSVIGPELFNKLSLLEWFLSNKDNENIYGFEHHFWNGITTLQYAQFLEEIFLNNSFMSLREKNPVLHLIKNESVSKYQLLMIFNKVFNRSVFIKATSSITEGVDRTLNSNLISITKNSMELALKEIKNYIDNKTKIYHA